MFFSIDFKVTGFIHFNQNGKVGEESNDNENEKKNQMRFIQRVIMKTSISFTVKYCSPVNTRFPSIPVSFTYEPPRFV
jgi:hypothetical protein